MAGKKKENPIWKNALILCIITLAAGFLLGLVYQITLEPIARQQEKTSLEAYQKVFAEAVDFQSTEELTSLALESQALFAEGGKDWDKISVTEAKQALDASGNQLGYVISVLTKEGYAGDISLSMGVDMEGNVLGVQILSHGESPGLGANAANDSFLNQYIGKSGEMQVVKTEAQGDQEIQAITGATITSEAVTRAVSAGLYFADAAKEVGE